MSEKEIVKLAIENDLVLEVYNHLHSYIMTDIDRLQLNLTKAHTDLKLVKKYADVNNLKAIKAIVKVDKEGVRG